MEEEDNKALKRTSESLEEKVSKKQKLDEEVEELKKHLQIMPNNDDDVYTKATHLALKRRLGEVEEESEVSLELLRFVRQQQQEGFRPEWCLDTSSIKIKINTKIKLVKQVET
uniref:Uncharacterized protein n=1 Tax=Tanacetum cinerariifolium TaxID=118510 RepID=A0A6L2JIB0_TANCI|nr:hypothetical protein [Tanacetum cinerariifolium]